MPAVLGLLENEGEGVVGAVSLDHHDLARGVVQFHADGEVEPRWDPAEAGDSYRCSPVSHA